MPPPGAGAGRPGTGVNRYAHACGESRNAGDMITMLMRDEDGVEIVHAHFEPLEPTLDFGKTEPAIHHQGRVTGADDGGIAAAAAAGHREFHHPGTSRRSSPPRYGCSAAGMRMPPSAS